MVVNRHGLRNYTPACDCHKYKNGGCNMCGYSKSEWELKILRFEENKLKNNRINSGIKNKKIFKANGIAKKRTIFD